MFGPDTSSSLTFSELEMLIEGANYIHTIRLNPVDKNEIAKNELQGLRSLFNKSIVIANDVEKGTVLTEGHVAFKKPGTGIPSNRLDEVLNRKVKYDLKRDHMLDLQDLEEQ
jgi:sialic acid synthase SpsE